MPKEKHVKIVERLDKFYLEAKRQILQNQSAITGLFPSNSAENSDASIKSSLWAASSIFALYLAYSKRVDNDQGKAHDLGQSVVKCMRGILFAWMRQSERVESFKANQCPRHALHLKFDLHSGLANDHEYPHLQIDVVSLYLIFLANFITSGLDIIYCMDEVTFIQNLVYYVERAYRTPDYGNWEPQSSVQHQHPQTNAQSSTSRDLPQVFHNQQQQHLSAHSQNNMNLVEPASSSSSSLLASNQNQASSISAAFSNCANCATNHESKSLEIHATSIGMAKSALEAINGCNLFGGKGANWSIIYSDIDAHSRNRSIFETLLPRESRSKNTDSYLLATISWPCFATSDPALYESTKSKILRKLRGKYGLKRFLRDPYGTVLGVPVLGVPVLGGDPRAPPSPLVVADTAAAFFERETSFSSIGSNVSSIEALNQQQQHQHQQPKVKQRKSSYFQRKTNTSSTPGVQRPGQDEFLSPSNLPADSSSNSFSLQRTVSNSAKMSKRFEHIESEWPLFVCFLIIDGIFKQNYDQVYEYEKLLYEKLLHEDPASGDYLMPKYYYVPFDLIGDEKKDPDSVERVASAEGSSSDRLYITGQAILLITRLLLNGLVHPNELDPLRRHQPAHDRPKRIVGRYSSFQATSPDLVVQTVLIAESIRLQAMMANYGIQTQTPREVEPVQIWSSAQLVKVYEYLGVNQKLGLKGRPARPIGALGTSKLYRICGQTIICYPLIFEVSDFYLAQDMLLLIDDIQNELNFIGRYWRMSGRPTVCIIIREEHLRDVHFRDLLDLLVQFKNGQLKKSGLRIKTGRLQNLISSSCIEHLDFLHLLPHEHLPQFQSFRQLVESPKQSLLLAQCQQEQAAAEENEDEDEAHSSGPRRRRPLNVARYSSQQQLQQRQHEQDLASASAAGLQPPSKSRRVLLCSASSNNLQAIEEQSTAAAAAGPSVISDESQDEDLDGEKEEPGEEEEDEHFHSMVWDQQNNDHSQLILSSTANSTTSNQTSVSDEDEYLSFGPTSGADQQQQQQQQAAETLTPPMIDYYECYKDAPTWPTLIELLRGCQELSGQSQLLHILWEREGAKYCVDEQSVEQRLERVGALACQTRAWSVVRYCSAVLRRSVESLSPWLTSILVNGKQISLGQGQNEKIISNPLTPTEIHNLIYSTASTKNPCDAVLQQEIALYIGRLISTRPEFFEGILTIRVGNFMSAMRSYLSIKSQERSRKLAEKQRAHQQRRLAREQQQHSLTPASGSQAGNEQLLDLRIKHEHESTDPNGGASKSKRPALNTSALFPINYVSHHHHQPQPQQQQHQQQQQITSTARPLESLSPSEVRKLLVRVLTDDQSLPISDRRQITGELCRVPRDFYDKVWSLLHFTNEGIVIGQRMLRSGPILTNMTQDDLNFALKVESILSSIDCPKLRQINVEFLMALHVVFERNPELRFDTEPIDLDRIIQLSLGKFRQDNDRQEYGLKEFYSMTTHMAMLYTVRTVFDCLLPAKFKGRDDFHFIHAGESKKE